VNRMLIDPKLYNVDQSWHYETLWELEQGKRRHKVKVEICRNAYNFQSYGRASLFSPTHMQWTCVAETPGPQLTCLGLSYVMTDASPHLKELEADTFKLIYEVGQLLDIEVCEAEMRPPAKEKERKHA